MDWSTAAKYAAGAAVVGSVFYLVVAGNIPASDYLNLTYAVLGALGIAGARAISK
jgi:hypothetical protein